MNTLQISDFESYTSIEINDFGSMNIKQDCLDCRKELVFLREDEVFELYRFLKDYYESNQE